MAHFEGKRYSCSCPNGICDMDCRMYRIVAGKPSNSDRIRAMTDEELAKWITELTDCAVFPYIRKDAPCISIGQTCVASWLDWLKQEASDDNNDH